MTSSLLVVCGTTLPKIMNAGRDKAWQRWLVGWLAGTCVITYIEAVTLQVQWRHLHIRGDDAPRSTLMRLSSGCCLTASMKHLLLQGHAYVNCHPDIIFPSIERSKKKIAHFHWFSNLEQSWNKKLYRLSCTSRFFLFSIPDSAI